MRLRVATIVLWMALLLGIVAAAGAARMDLAAGVEPAARPPGGSRARSGSPASLRSDSLARVVAAGDPFRVARRAAAVAFDPRREMQVVEEAEAPPRPVLVLRGIILSDSAHALIEGFPGIEGGRLVHVGETVAGVRVRSVSAMAVRLTGLDTAWVLTLGRLNP